MSFGAEEESRFQSPDGVIHHATVKIGDSMIEMGEAHGPSQPMPTTFFMYVDDVDAWYERAVGAGGTSRGAPADQPYGDRVGGVADPFANPGNFSDGISDALRCCESGCVRPKLQIAPRLFTFSDKLRKFVGHSFEGENS